VENQPARTPARPVRAIAWRPWGAAAFAEAAAHDRPVLLLLGAVWCEACRRVEDTTFAEPRVAAILNERFVPVRVDGDRLPHVQTRYIAGGWPTVSFLTPTGEVLWTGVAPDATVFLSSAGGVLAAWTERRGALLAEIERRRRALEAAHARHRGGTMLRRSAPVDLMRLLHETFDARNGGFGPPPRFPQPDVLTFLLGRARRGDTDAAAMLTRTLDGILAGELHDAGDGGFFRYALEADWTRPRFEKRLDTNAGLLAVFGPAAAWADRADWADAAGSIVRWADTTLAGADGLWTHAQHADNEWFAADVATRAGRPGPPPDPTVLTDRAAAWIEALATAGAALGHAAWVERAASALVALLRTMAAPDDLLFHMREGAAAATLDRLLADPLAAACACTAVARHGGHDALQAEAVRLADGMVRAFWAADGGLCDHALAERPGALRHAERDFQANARAGRLLLEVWAATDRRGLRSRAEQILALLSPVAPRYGTDAAGFAIAVDAFFGMPA
jgi:uncharacterized protein YyaL (SSP411 family)